MIASISIPTTRYKTGSERTYMRKHHLIRPEIYLDNVLRRLGVLSCRLCSRHASFLGPEDIGMTCVHCIRMVLGTIEDCSNNRTSCSVSDAR